MAGPQQPRARTQQGPNQRQQPLPRQQQGRQQPSGLPQQPSSRASLAEASQAQQQQQQQQIPHAVERTGFPAPVRQSVSAARAR